MRTVSSRASMLGAIILLVWLYGFIPDAVAHRQQFKSGLTVLLSGRPVTGGGMATPNVTTPDQVPCDLRENACMDWCGPTVRRPGFCPNGQMCCLLIY